MTPRFTSFERRIARIHRLLEAEGSVITWNDRIPDPDNPRQPRQIDVTIRRDGRLTLVECRIHKEPQDVTWIEELIGRRASLQADAAIAVSASGFTTGAEAKAERFGIILRHFNTLTQDEIRNWGKERSVELIFYRFTGTKITFELSDPPAPPIVISDCKGNQVRWRSLFEQLMNESDRENLLERSATVSANFEAPIFVNGVRAVTTQFEATIHRVTREVRLASVVVYSNPFDGNDISHAAVAQFDLGESEIIEASDQVSVVVDLSQVDIPEHCLFRTILFDFGRVVEMRGAQFIGVQEAMTFQNSISFQFKGI
jgi:hypothetical protein